MRRYLLVVLIDISLIINDVEHSFVCLLAFACPLGKCLFRPSTHFLIRFFAVELHDVLIYFDINYLSVISFANILFK